MDADARLALGAPLPRRTLEVCGVTLAYHDAGSGAALICLHAVGHGASDFESFSRSLTATHRVIALDLPGHGASSDDTTPPSYERYVALLDGFVRGLGLDRIVLVGNSLGGGIALSYAASHPERVRGVLLCDPAGLIPVRPWIRWGTRFMAAFFACGRWGGLFYRLAFGIYYRVVLRARAATAQRERIVRACPEMYDVTSRVWRTFGTAQADLRGCAERITCPVLFAWARGDVLVRLAPSRAAIARFQNAELVTFSGGHSPFLEQPDEFVRVAERFLSRLEGRS